MKIRDLENKKILILGYGKEGKATEAYLLKKVKSVEIDHLDMADCPDYLQKQKGYDLIIKTPGIPKRHIDYPYTTASNIFFANCIYPVIGITGTKGKSTTASLIHHILTVAGKKTYLVGNIGTPALEKLSEVSEKTDVFVMELSSYQLDDITYSPHISVILNLFPEHMDYHTDITGYFNAKQNMVLHAGKKDYLIYNSRYKELDGLAKKATCQTIDYTSYDVPVTNSEISLKGEHNRENIQAALAVCDILHINKEFVIKALKSFKPLAHRLQNIGTYRGITFYDDAISTTPQSTIQAIRTLTNISVIMLGGLDRGYDFSGLAETVLQAQIPYVILFPDSGTKILESFKSKTDKLPVIFLTDNMKEAVKFAYRHAPSGSICLLSTASPSYSLWKNFEEKGDLFAFNVRNYEKKAI